MTEFVVLDTETGVTLAKHLGPEPARFSARVFRTRLGLPQKSLRVQVVEREVVTTEGADVPEAEG